MLRRWLVTLIGIAMMAASVYAYSWYAGEVDEQVQTTQVLMPTRLIASGETIEAGMLRNVSVPIDAVQETALNRPEEVLGKTAVVPIGPEEQILPWKLADVQLTPRDGERYISFKTEEVTNVSNMIRRGDRVDVWVEFAEAKQIGGEWLGAIKIIEGLRVASVRTAEGAEVADSVPFEAQFQPTGRQQERIRSGANGKPDINTFIMSEPVYEAYALGRLVGTVKIALPDLSLPASSPTTVTDQYRLLAAMLTQQGGAEQ
jgi:Flp pilus assembly protein CpaB